MKPCMFFKDKDKDCWPVQQDCGQDHPACQTSGNSPQHTSWWWYSIHFSVAVCESLSLSFEMAEETDRQFFAWQFYQRTLFYIWFEVFQNPQRKTLCGREVQHLSICRQEICCVQNSKLLCVHNKQAHVRAAHTLGCSSPVCAAEGNHD